MKFLKRNQLNSRNVADNRVAVELNGEVKLDTNVSVLVPNGTTAQRPSGSVEGRIRYNETTQQFEGFQGSAWRAFAFKESIGIIQQDIGIGTSVDGGATGDIYFGPLVPAPASIVDVNTDWTNNGNVLTPGNTWTGANILVIVENVIQLFDTNYTIENNPTATGNGAEITTGAFVNGTSYVITNVGDTNFTLIGASSNTVGVVFTATGGGGGTTGKARKAGWYVKTGSAVPLGKHVTVLHGFDR